MKRINIPLSIKKAVSQTPLIIGVAPNAWPRIVASWFFPKFKILCLRDRQDNDEIDNQGINIFSLKKIQPNLEVSPLTSSRILNLEASKRFLKSQSLPFALLVYKSTPILEKVAQENGWRLIANSPKIKNIYEDKRIFKNIIKKVGLKPIPGENLLIEELTREKINYFQRYFGQKKLVLQLAEVTYGGGSGTLFINHSNDWRIFQQRVKEIRFKLQGKKKKIKTVNVSPFIDSISSSISACATRFGILTAPIQTQIIDQQAVGMKKTNRSGNFCGHDWSFRHYSAKIQHQARIIAKKLGQYMYQHDYRGIFGVDLLIDEIKEKVWPMECNPRFTDAFPMVSLLLMEQGQLPMDIFHILELLGQDYEIDFKQIEKGYQQARLDGGQIILHNLLETEAVNKGVLKAGVYRLKEHKLKFLRSGITPFDLKEPEEFLFTEGIVRKPGEIFKSSARLGRLINKSGLLLTNKELKPRIKEIINLAYRQLNLNDVYSQ